MSETTYCIAVLAADIHLQHTCPPARAAEPSWYECMKRQLWQLDDVASKHQAPIILAGDIFDRWNAPPELVNFAISHMPSNHCYAIPGQHDLPHHNIADVERTSYETLRLSGAIISLLGGGHHAIRPIELLSVHDHPAIVVHPFPWGAQLHPLEYNGPPKINNNKIIHLAVVHSYIWTEGNSYPGAPEEQKLGAYKKQLVGYHAAVFGDNHKGFLCKSGDTWVFNCGAFIPRKADERHYKPSCGLLMSDGTIQQHFFDTSYDKWSDEVVTAGESYESSEKLTAYLEELRQAADTPLDFAEACRQALQKGDVSDAAANLLRDVLNAHTKT